MVNFDGSAGKVDVHALAAGGFYQSFSLHAGTVLSGGGSGAVVTDWQFLLGANLALNSSAGGWFGGGRLGW